MDRNLSVKLILLSSRNYSLKKIQENNTSEIMQTVLEDARESYGHEIIVELQSDSTEELDSNVARIVDWIEKWKENNSATG
jgi:adenylate kinase